MTELKECSICLDNITTENESVRTCGHVFHTECINAWLTLNTKCPMCRNIITNVNDYKKTGHLFLLTSALTKSQYTGLNTNVFRTKLPKRQNYHNHCVRLVSLHRWNNNTPISIKCNLIGYAELISNTFFELNNTEQFDKIEIIVQDMNRCDLKNVDFDNYTFMLEILSKTSKSITDLL